MEHCPVGTGGTNLFPRLLIMLITLLFLNESLRVLLRALPLLKLPDVPRSRVVELFEPEMSH